MCGRPPDDCRDSLAHAAVLLGLPSLAVGETPEETYWFCANHDPGVGQADVPAWSSRRFEATGYCISRNDRGDHLIFDCGPHGFLNGGHAHADALSIVLTVGGRPLLVDPGTATYTMDHEVRDQLRSTAMHNTVVVDGRSQSQPHGPFHWASATDATCTAWISRPDLDYAEGRHDGYAGLTHVRQVLALHGAGWLVVDHLTGEPQRVTADVMWHLHPSWIVTRADDKRMQLRTRDVELAMVSSVPLEEVHGPLATFAPVYGRVEPAPCLAASVHGEAPMTIATFIPASAEWLPEALHVGADGSTIEVISPTQRLVIRLKSGAIPRVERCAE
jgi:hypothetical protein